MGLIGFKDTCEITRLTGQMDEWDNPVYDLVYSGKCLYEEGGSYYSSQIFVKSPNVFIPRTEELILTGDVVQITTERGRIVEGVARGIRDINLSTFSKLEMTRIELEQAQDREE